MRYTYLLLFLFISQLAMAQEPQADACVLNIETAQQKYDEGRIQDIQALLIDCLAAGNYTKAEESQALRLLTLSYIFLDDEVNAEYNMLLLLKANHEFEVNPVIDPTEFINLHDRFRTKPLFNLGLRYIVNFSQPIVTDLNSMYNLSGERHDYSLIFSIFGIGANFEYEFAENFIIYPEIHYKSISVAYSAEQVGAINTNSDTAFFKTEYFEDQQWLTLPVSVKYNFDLKNMPAIKVYANAGVSVDLLLKAALPADGTTLNNPGGSEIGFALTTTNDHNLFNFGVFAGAGITYKLGEGFLSLEGRYQYNFTKFTKPEKVLTPENPEQTNMGAQHDIYKLNHIGLSIGYTKYMYFPKKLR
jgi:hypothetical protein